MSFKEWLSKDSPQGAGEIWDNRSNSDMGFGKNGVKSKNVTPEKSIKSNFDPEKLFFGISMKRNLNKNNGEEK
jgi:hypothetical protein